jgi:hypothetical protein
MSGALNFDAVIRARRDTMRGYVRNRRLIPSPAHALRNGAFELDQLSERVMREGISGRTSFSTAETLRMAAEELDARGFGGSIAQALEARIKVAETARVEATARANAAEKERDAAGVLCAIETARVGHTERKHAAALADNARLRRVIAHVLAQVGQAVNADAGIDLVVRRGKPGARDTLTLAEWQDIALLIADARNTPNQGGQQTPGGDAKLR